MGTRDENDDEVGVGVVEGSADGNSGAVADDDGPDDGPGRNVVDVLGVCTGERTDMAAETEARDGRGDGCLRLDG